jgi:hypothetical protein
MNPMAWLGGPERCALSRPLASPEDLEACGMEIHFDGAFHVEIWKVPRGLLSRSLVVQKLAAWEEGRQSYVIRPSCRETLRSIGVAIDWPRRPEEVEAWISACDFLMVVPQLHEVAFAVTCAMHSWLKRAKAQLSDCSSFEALAHSRRMKSYGGLAKIVPMNREAADQEMYAYGSPSRSMEEQMVLSLDSFEANRFLASIRCDALAEGGLSVGTAVDLLAALVCHSRDAEEEETPSGERHAFSDSPPHLAGAVEMVTQTLLCLTNTAKGSLYLLSEVLSLRAAFGTPAARHFVHRCFCCLYLAETFDQVDLCAIPLETACELQDFYREGMLSLCCFMPARDGLCFLLPGLLGAREVAPLLRTVEDIFGRACDSVPWLFMAMTGSHTLHLTGSFLCWCRTAQEPTLAPPGDVDLFCEREADLEETAAHVAASMLEYARILWSDAYVSVASINAYRRVLAIRLPTNEARLTGVGVPVCALNCDIYVNNTKKVIQYHLPQVRCSLSLESGSPKLFLTASAAISWITMLNVDYNAFRGAKTPFEIIAKRWLWGFNLCVSESEARLLRDYLRVSHPLEYMEKNGLRRPRRLIAHVGCVLRS